MANRPALWPTQGHFSPHMGMPHINSVSSHIQCVPSWHSPHFALTTGILTDWSAKQGEPKRLVKGGLDSGHTEIVKCQDLQECNLPWSHALQVYMTCGTNCITLPHTPPPCQWPPNANGPPTRNEESCPRAVNGPPFRERRIMAPRRVFWLKNPMILAYFVAAKCYQLDIQDYFGHKRKYIRDGSACGLCFNNIAFCVLPMLELLGPGNPRELTCLLPIQELPRDADN